jgi:hypothetical protein
MKSEPYTSPTGFQVLRNPNASAKYTALNHSILAIAAALVLAAGPAHALNILVNPGFESLPTGHNSVTNPATGWTYFSPPPPPNYFGDFWVDDAVPAHSGTFYWKEWGALYSGTNNVAGIYQTSSSTPGSTYQASGWFYTSAGDLLGADCTTWVQVEFLDTSSNILALYKSSSFSASVGSGGWFQYQVTNSCDLTQPVATGDPYFTTYAVTGSVSQLLAPPGTAAARYRYCYLQFGSEGGSSFLDDADLEQLTGPIPPVISNLYPQNMIFVNPGSNFSFNVSSPSGHTINNSGIQLVLNGTNVSASLAISGSSSNKTAIYSGLHSNTAYTVSITVTDSFNFAASANTYFETTWVGVPPVTFLWEAEDWDFTNGMYLDNPDLCNAPGDPDCYFGTVGVEGVDEHNVLSGPSHFYRANDPEGTAPSGDYSRPNLFTADRIDYCINPFNSTEWVNYTRDWPNSTNWVIGRLSTDIGLSGSVTMSVVNPGVSTNALGTFTINGGRGWSAFENVYLKDTNGDNANVVLNGRETLRATSGGNLLPTFYMLVPAQLDLPVLSGMYPTGAHPFEYTNSLTFTATTAGSTFPSGGIKVNLDGNDISSSLVITGPGSAENVAYPALQLNSAHTAIITVTNALGHGIAVTNQFDTFTQTNPMIEAEDFDYDGGQYLSFTDWYPEAYQGFIATTGIDFEHSTIAGELYPYRNGIPQSLVQNYTVEARQSFINYGAQDYQLDWFGIGDWANYTDVYPTGGFFVYVRSAGLAGIPFSMDLNRVVSGAGTTNQVTMPLGQFSAVGINQQTYAWVPLTDAGLVAPVVVKLGGVGTLQITTPTGDCYPNYFMLVPAAGVTLSVVRAGTSVNISFPTHNGAFYRVFYRADLASGNWTLLTTVTGNGATKSVTDPGAGSRRFYKVTSP